ncbi:MAG: hypothetical protein F6J96_14720 [Symploca sp. SIO1C2]|nr:hypothetical protein [Symploca sp. SIO1C2]
MIDRLDELVRTAWVNDGWGRIGGKLREHILGTGYQRLGALRYANSTLQLRAINQFLA